MSRQPIPHARAADWPGQENFFAIAESLGITRLVGRTYVMGGNIYGNIMDAIAHGRHLQLGAGGL